MRGKLEQTIGVLSSYGNHRALLKSVSVAQWKKELSLDFYVVDLESVPILELEVCTRFSLVKKVGSLTANLSPRQAILCDYKDNFEGLRCMPQEYHIEIQKDATSVAHPKYVLTCMAKWWKLYFVGRKVVSLLRWISPQTREHYKIPTADEVASKLTGKKVFSILDEKDGFWKIPLDQKS